MILELPLAILFALAVFVQTQTVTAPTDPSFENELNSTTENHDYTCGLNAHPYLDENQDIGLNITWQLNRSYPLGVEKVKITDVINKNNPFHPADSMPGFNMSQDGGILYKGQHHAFKFRLNRKYNITFVGTRCFLQYTFPDCVETKCNCSKMTTPVNFTVEYYSGNKYKVFWTLNGPYLLRNVTFRIQPDEMTAIALNMSTDYPISANGSGSGMLYMDNRTSNMTIIGLFENQNYCEYRSTFELLTLPTERYLGLVIFMLSVIILIMVVLLLYYSKRKAMWKNPIGKRNVNINMLYTSYGVNNKLELSPDAIKTLAELDRGEFGIVYRAEVLNLSGQLTGWTQVAAKMLREKASDEAKEDFLYEIETLRKIPHHPNIVKLYGCCTLQEPLMMIMEFIPCGSLIKYLLNLRSRWESMQSLDSVFTNESGDCTYIRGPSRLHSYTDERNDRPSVATQFTNLTSVSSETPLINWRIECILDHKELQTFALQIAKGMAHLEKIPITHRDLAARNILINEHKQLKISDFGMSRTGPYVNQKKKKIPLRWWAVESIESNFTDSRSDVWSFGVVLWEIGTLGAFPYKEFNDAILPHKILTGHRLEMPKICTEELYRLMLRCWSHQPELRPTFNELVDLLDNTKRRVYTDFKELDPKYVFPSATEN